jgi:hypothetical protein
MPRIFRAIAKDYLRSLIIAFISAAIVIPLACVLVFIPLGIAVQTEDTTTGMLFLVISVTLFLLILIGGGLGIIPFVFLRRTRQYDAIFAPLGLKGKMYMVSGRQYHGTVRGRQIDVYFYRGPTLDMRASTAVQTRLSVVGSDAVSLPLARAFGREPLSLPDPGLSGLTVFAHDEEWALLLLANPEVKALLRQLILGESFFLMQQLYLEPGTFSLRLYRNKGLFQFKITPDEARQWLNGLLSLARIAETMPTPR